MSVLMVPRDEKAYPSLGGQVCAWIEENLVYGPGDLRGQPVHLDQEKRALVYRMYEVFPQGHPQAGRRRFKRVALSIRKGCAKTEFAAMIAAAELHPEGPVRCDGFDARGDPVGRGVTDPYIPLVAYTEEQSDELAFGALRVILMYSAVAEDFDIGIERIMRINGDGKAVSLASSPDSRDGARTTFQVCDETHRWNLPRLKAAHRTMLANMPKRKAADAWMLEVTTSYSPGEGSVAEDTMSYARQVDEGKITDPRLFFFHRQASDGHDLKTAEGVKAAVLEASGPAVAAWSDIDAICQQWEDPTADRAYLERVWLNRPVRASERAFDYEAWQGLAVPGFRAPEGETITLGFDGARWRDSVALVGTHLESGTQFLLGLWEKPTVLDSREAEEWEAPDEEIDARVALAFETWNVWRMYCDPPYWETQVATWAGRYGQERVVAWWTNRQKAMGYALRGFRNAIQAGEVHHDGNADLARHYGNAVRKTLNIVTEEGDPLWLIYKERSDSVFKIDAAMAGVLSWQARCDALASGVGNAGDLNEALMSGEMRF
jgi:phage terminase large subunit-like protein